MNKQTIYRFATLLVPIICLFVAIGVILFEAHRFHQLNQELTTTEKQLTQLERLIKDLQAQPPIEVTPTIAQSTVEQPDFLDSVRTTASTAHVQLTRWSNSGSGAASNAGATAAAAKTNLPPGVTPITSSIEVAGSYNDLRHFLYGLESAPRLLTLSDMVWTRNEKWPITSLKFNLTRYVEPAGHAPLKAIPATAPTKTASTGTTIAALPPSEGPHILPASNVPAPGLNKAATMKGNP